MDNQPDEFELFDQPTVVLAPTGEELLAIHKQVERAKQLQQEMLTYKAAFEAAKAEYQTITTYNLPKLLREARTTEWVGDDGTKVELDDFVTGSLPKDDDKKEVAIDYAVSLGGASLVSNSVELNFKKGDNRIELAIELLKKAELPFSTGRNIHHSTLQAFVRQLIEQNKEVEPGKLGCYHGYKASVITPKSRKQK